MIGLASILLLASAGRIAGISGILSRLLPPYEDGAWRGEAWRGRAAFALGLVMAAPVAMMLGGADFPAPITSSPVVLVMAGLLVGFGATLGGGCTSGHGVCGLARLSARSAVAVVTFMTTGFLTLFLVRHIL